jgi:CheY-like chemotaxis protein
VSDTTPCDPPDHEGATVRKVSVLLAEDDRVNQRVATRMLEKLGCVVDVAVNGREAIEKLKQGSYDLVFLDVLMPVLDGFEAAREINATWERAARPPLVAMTANVMRGDRERCLQEGMDDYVSKPVSSDEMARVIAQWVRRG